MLSIGPESREAFRFFDWWLRLPQSLAQKTVIRVTTSQASSSSKLREGLFSRTRTEVPVRQQRSLMSSVANRRSRSSWTTVRVWIFSFRISPIRDLRPGFRQLRPDPMSVITSSQPLSLSRSTWRMRSPFWSWEETRAYPT